MVEYLLQIFVNPLILKIKIKLHSNPFPAVLLSMVISLSPPSTGDYFFIAMIHSEIISGVRT